MDSRGRRICQSQPVPSPSQSLWEHLQANDEVRLLFIEVEQNGTITLCYLGDIVKPHIKKVEASLCGVSMLSPCGSHRPKTCYDYECESAFCLPL